VNTSGIAIRDRELFQAVLRLIFSCTQIVASEIDNSARGSSIYSQADRDKLKHAVKGLRALGLIAWIVENITQAGGDARV
jgi:hypothetical protein